MAFRPGTRAIAVNTARAADLLAKVRARLDAGQGFAVATLNLDHLVKLRQGGAFEAAYAAQDLVVADGNPIVWLSRLARRPVDLVPGSDLVRPLARTAAAAGAPVALLGSTEAALAAAAEVLKAETPGLSIAGTFAPPMGFDPGSAAADALLDQVAASGAGLVYLALGAPKQEILAARGRARHPGLGFASIGAGLDFLAGTQTRAPAWVRRLALEWAWRMALSPRRLAARYGACALMLPGLALHAWRLRSSDRSA